MEDYDQYEVGLPEKEGDVGQNIATASSKEGLQIEAPIETPSQPLSDDLSGQERPKLTSVWVKPSTWKRLVEVKADLDLQWSELIDVLIQLAAQNGLVQEKTIEGWGDQDFEESYVWKKSVGLGQRWSQSAGEIKKIREELEKIEHSMSELIEVVEDHAEAMVLEENQ